MDETEKIIIDRFKEMFSNPELLFENKKLLYKTNLDREIRDCLLKAYEEVRDVEGFLRICLLLNFDSQLYLLSQVAMEEISSDETAENWLNLTEAVLEDIYSIDNEEDEDNKIEYLKSIKTIFNGSPEHFNLDLSEQLSEWLDFSDLYCGLEEDKEVKLDAIRNPTKLSNMILNNEEINEDTYKYMGKNHKFFSSFSHTLYSKFLLREIINSEDHENKKILFRFFIKLAKQNQNLFRELVRKLKIFIRENDETYFKDEQNIKDLRKTVEELKQESKVGSEVIHQLVKIFSSEEKDINRKSFFEDNEYKTVVDEYLFQGKGWQKVFSTPNEKLTKQFLNSLFSVWNFEKLDLAFKNAQPDENNNIDSNSFEFSEDFIKAGNYFNTLSEEEASEMIKMLQNYNYYLNLKRLKETHGNKYISLIVLLIKKWLKNFKDEETEKISEQLSDDLISAMLN